MWRDMFHVDDETVKKVLINHNTNQYQLEKDVEIVRNWVKTQPHFPEIMDDAKIRNFILLNKCSIEKTKEKIDNYYSIRSKIPELYDNCNPKLPNMKKCAESGYYFAHPKPVHGLHRCFWLALQTPNAFLPSELAMIVANIGEIRMVEDKLMDDLFILDMQNVTFTDLLQITLPVANRILTVYEKIYSLRIKSIYFINSPTYIATLISLLKSILKPKIFNRIEVYENAEVLQSLFSPDELPKEYGGLGPTMKQLQEMTDAKINQYQYRFDQLDKLRVDEKLRPEKLNNDDMLGFHGNFKKLAID